MLATQRIIDIIFVVLAIIAICITAIVVAKVVTDTFHTMNYANVQENTKLIITDLTQISNCPETRHCRQASGVETKVR